MAYTVQPVVARGLLPRLLANLAAVALLYAGVRLNIGLLGLPLGQLESLALMLSFVALGLISVMLPLQVLKTAYVFSYNMVFIQGQNLTLEVTQPQVRRNLLDRLFRTCSVSLQGGRLNYLPDDQRLISYIQQLAWQG